MTKLLFIQASPRGEQSKSIQVAQTYLDALKATNPALEMDVLPIWETELPAFDGDKANAKVNVFLGQEQSPVQQTAWDQVVEIASRFIAADRYLFAVPMWNGTIPYRLKQYIDIIHQPGLLFGLKPETGYFGLLENKHATLVLTSGAYADSRPSPAFGVDNQSTYLKSLAQPGRRHRHRRGEIPAHAPDARSPRRAGEGQTGRGGPRQDACARLTSLEGVRP